MKKKKKYVIWAPSLKKPSGGVLLLHKLSYMIKKLGYEAYLWPGDNNHELFLTYAKYGNLLATEDMINNDAIVIYPEIVVGNPLKAKNVVRWLLNKPGVLGGDGIFAENDLIYYFSKAFSENNKSSNYLYFLEYFGNLFKNNNLERSGSCYTMYKRKDRITSHDLRNSIEITSSTSIEDTVKIFNTTRFFISYDEVTFLSIQAALCGCISIVVPVKGLSKEEWMNQDPIRKYGIAYGEENIEHAVLTMEKVRPHMQFLEGEFYNNVENFIKDTQDWAKTKENGLNNSSGFTLSDFKTIGIKLSEAEKFIEEGELYKAKEILQNILNNNPSNVIALNYLSIISILEKKYDEAEKIIDEVLQLEEQNDIANDNYEYIQEIVK